MIVESIPYLINDNINNMFTLIPSHDKIKAAVFNLNKDNSLGPDGYGGLFFKKDWTTINLDDCNDVI